jgi:PAS domain-containing protein
LHSWAKLVPQSLAGRVFALFAGTLIAFFGIGVGIYYYQQFTTGVDDALDSGQILSEVMMPTITDSVVIGDYDTVRRTLAKAIQRSSFASIGFIDRKGGVVRAERTAPFANYSPEWLRSLVRERLSDVNQVVAVGGRDYGVLRMRFAPEVIAGNIWKVTSSALAVGATMLLVGLLLIRVSLHRWLGGLDRIRDYDWRFNAGAADRETALRNAPIEIREAFDAFMRTGTELQVQRVTADATLNAVDDGVVTTDGEGRILYVNPAAEAVLHGSSGPLLQQDIGAVLPALFEDRGRDGRLEAW